MKKIACVAIIFAICVIFLAACSSTGSSSQTANAEKLILGKVSTSADLAIDLRTIEKIKANSDVVAIGTIKKIEKVGYDKDTSVCTTVATIECSEIIKGDVSKNFSFSTYGGYIPYSEYIKTLDDIAKTKMKVDTYTEEQKKNGYFLVQMDDNQILSEGKEYIVFLGKEPPSGGLYTTGTYHGLIRIENGKAYQTQSGEGKPLDEVLSEVRS